MKIIIIEGVDQIGKSTLIKYLSENIPNSVVAQELNNKNILRNVLEVRNRPEFFETRHIGILEQVKDQFYTFSKYPAIFPQDITYIFDRLHWAAYVYAKVLRPDALAKVFKFDENMIRYNQIWEQEMLTFNPDIRLLTFCIPDDVEPNADDFVRNKEYLKHINREYRKIWQMSDIPDKYLIELSWDKEKSYSNMSEKFDEILKLCI